MKRIPIYQPARQNYSAGTNAVVDQSLSSQRWRLNSGDACGAVAIPPRQNTHKCSFFSPCNKVAVGEAGQGISKPRGQRLYLSAGWFRGAKVSVAMVVLQYTCREEVLKEQAGKFCSRAIRIGV